MLREMCRIRFDIGGAAAVNASSGSGSKNKNSFIHERVKQLLHML
jgi:hypothetical protein